MKIINALSMVCTGLAVLAVAWFWFRLWQHTPNLQWHGWAMIGLLVLAGILNRVHLSLEKTTAIPDTLNPPTE